MDTRERDNSAEVLKCSVSVGETFISPLQAMPFPVALKSHD